MAIAKCYIYDIVEPNPENNEAEVWLKVHQLMERPNCFGKTGSRSGFVSTLVQQEVLAGFFANEARKRGIQYTDDKKPVDADAFYSFLNIFFSRYSWTHLNLSYNSGIFTVMKALEWVRCAKICLSCRQFCYGLL